MLLKCKIWTINKYLSLVSTIYLWLTMESSVTWSQIPRRLTDKKKLCCQKSKKLMSKIQDLPICFCLTKSFHSSPVQTLVPRYAAENLSDWRVLSFLYLPEFIFKKISFKGQIHTSFQFPTFILLEVFSSPKNTRNGCGFISESIILPSGEFYCWN